MGYLPHINAIQTDRDYITQFGGYNHNSHINPNEWFDMRNLSSDEAPLVTVRKPRKLLRKLEKSNGLFAHTKLCWVDGTKFYYDGEEKGQVEDSKKQFVAMGAYILIWPDKVGYNTHTGEFFSLGNKVTVAGAKWTLCKPDGIDYDYKPGAEPPAEPENGTVWLDTSGDTHVLKVYSSYTGMWTSVPTTYVKIASEGIGNGFAEGDGVEISGMTEESLNGSYTLTAVNDDSLIIVGIIDKNGEQNTEATVERKIPDMEFLTESQNRVWGCNSDEHQIYACALGDPKNWFKFPGTAADSYFATIGTPGRFTGAATHLGYVLFFKGDVVHKVYGNKPSNFEITDTNCRGVEAGSEKSLVLVNETLFYKSKRDVCTYNAALPSPISEALGDIEYRHAAAGTHGDKYYISMQDEYGAWAMMVYDGRTGLWHREDETHAEYFASYDDDMFFINEDDKGLYSVNGSEAYKDDAVFKEETSYEWSAVSAPIGLDSPDQKYISKIQLRIQVEEGALFRVEVQYEGEMHRGSIEWKELFRINPLYRRSYTIPLIPRRCDTMRIRISGYGKFILYSISKTIEQGGDG